MGTHARHMNTYIRRCTSNKVSYVIRSAFCYIRHVHWFSQLNIIKNYTDMRYVASILRRETKNLALAYSQLMRKNSNSLLQYNGAIRWFTNTCITHSGYPLSFYDQTR